MELFNVLASDVAISFLGGTYEISLNWVGRLVKILISSGVGVGLGVILFSLILKVIVLPFDVFQRIAMRKQNIKMKENKDKMEKLQKQYANDKKMYNQKLMEIQKQNGISLLSSCLPMVLSMVVFFVAIGAFNAYSKYTTVENYNTMATAFTDKVNEYVVDIDDAKDETKNDKYTFVSQDGKNYIKVEEDGKLIYCLIPTEKATATDAEMQAEVFAYTGNKYYYVDGEAFKNKIVEENGEAYYTENYAVAGMTEEDYQTKVKAYFDNLGAKASADVYHSEIKGKTKFLWVKNIWAVDASYKHPILSHKDFVTEISSAGCASSCGCGSNGSFKTTDGAKLSMNKEGIVKDEKGAIKTNVYEENSYNKVTSLLGEQKEQANGYFILIVLSIGTILLQQFVTSRSQKEQQKYSSADGQSASTQKMTMIMMTVMFGVFSFMYSSAFSIYMVTSNLFSLGSTLLINKAVDVSMRKKEQKALQEKYNRRLPRDGKNKSDKKRK
ncbi:MAG: membrane protein insertase YidC [Clostridiales bacterium]|nr:membrane protein insertase YidC [Clostridiales bacterium]